MKTRKSLTPVHLPSVLIVDLEAWKARYPDPSPDTFIFSNEDGGFLDTGNFRKRVLHQLAEILNLPKLTFQVILRTIATLSQTKGSIKSTQGLLRHERLPTTSNVYVQILLEGVQQMVDSAHGELRKPGNAAEQTSEIAQKLRSPKQRSLTRKNEKLTPIDTKQQPYPVGYMPLKC